MNWTTQHFCILLPLMLLSVLLAIASRRMSDRTYLHALRTLTVLLLCCELVKQLLAIRNYSPLFLPFHYSTTYYLCLVLYAFGGDRTRHYGSCLLYAGGLLLLVSMLFSPTSIIGTLEPEELFGSFYHFYSLFYHIAVLLVFLCMLARRDYSPRLYDPLLYISFLLLWGAIVIPMSRVVNFNYAGLLVSYIAPLEKLRQQAGDAIYLIVYFGAVMILAALAIYLYRAVRASMNKRLTNLHKLKESE